MRSSIFRPLSRVSKQYSLPLSIQSTRLRNPQTHLFRAPQLRPASQFATSSQIPLQASYASYVLVLVAACGSAIAYGYIAGDKRQSTYEAASPPVIEELPSIQDPRHPKYSEMAVPDGTLGNLTPEQEAKLREFWLLLLKTFGLTDPDHPELTEPAATPAPTEPDTTPKKKRRSFFSRGNHDDAPGSPASGTAAEDDKYGQTAELQQILKTISPESLRETSVEMMKTDHPDALMLRFLRARKWDVQKALAMLVSTMHWRQQMKVDDGILVHGEGGALADSEGSEGAVQKEGADYLKQYRMGKSFIHGTDKDGRPITYVRVRLHRGGEQSESSMEKFTVSIIETARLTLSDPVETGVIVFDMTNFTLANMDYTPVKFMIKVFEANYPECLGVVLVHKAPWVFQGIWRIIRGWLDPVVAAKVHFTNNAGDMETFIPKDHIIKDLEGDENWEYKYVEVVKGENDAMKDTSTRDKLKAERYALHEKYVALTFKWIAAAKKANSTEEMQTIKKERNEIAAQLTNKYWQLDPYIRARTLYDRVGMISRTGQINFYPQHTLKVENLNGTTSTGDALPKAETNTDGHVA